MVLVGISLFCKENSTLNRSCSEKLSYLTRESPNTIFSSQTLLPIEVGVKRPKTGGGEREEKK